MNLYANYMSHDILISLNLGKKNVYITWVSDLRFQGTLFSTDRTRLDRIAPNRHIIISLPMQDKKYGAP